MEMTEIPSTSQATRGRPLTKTPLSKSKNTGANIAKLVSNELTRTLVIPTPESISTKVAADLTQDPKIQKAISLVDKYELNKALNNAKIEKIVLDCEFRIKKEYEKHQEEMIKDREAHVAKVDELRHRIEGVNRHGFYTTQEMIIKHLNALRTGEPFRVQTYPEFVVPRVSATPTERQPPQGDLQPER